MTNWIDDGLNRQIPTICKGSFEAPLSPCPGVGLPHRQHRGARGLREQEEQRGEPGGRVHRARGPGRLRQIQPHVRHPGTNHFDSVAAIICYYVIMLVS